MAPGCLKTLKSGGGVLGLAHFRLNPKNELKIELKLELNSTAPIPFSSGS